MARISEHHYEAYIQNAANNQWKKKLSTKALAKIFELSERHPYSINKLCSLVWLRQYPTEQDVIDCWHSYAMESKPVIEKELYRLTLNQRKLLAKFASDPLIKETYSESFSHELSMPISSIAKSINKLKESDYIYINEDGYYRIVDPIIRYLIA